jgi:hypothetical protein
MSQAARDALHLVDHATRRAMLAKPRNTLHFGGHQAIAQ